MTRHNSLLKTVHLVAHDPKKLRRQVVRVVNVVGLEPQNLPLQIILERGDTSPSILLQSWNPREFDGCTLNPFSQRRHTLGT